MGTIIAVIFKTIGWRGVIIGASILGVILGLAAGGTFLYYEGKQAALEKIERQAAEDKRKAAEQHQQIETDTRSLDDKQLLDRLRNPDRR